jgi:hypothetical protein
VVGLTRANLAQRGYLAVLSITVRTARPSSLRANPKPTYPPLIEFPTEQLQLMPVTVEHKAPAHGGQTWQAHTDLPSLPHQAKITVH